MRISTTLMKLGLLWVLLQQQRSFLEQKCLVNHGLYSQEIGNRLPLLNASIVGGGQYPPPLSSKEKSI